EVFQRGVRSYIKRHRESNTVARDLWDALSEAAGRDVDAVVKPFVEQPGFPLLRIEQCDDEGVPSLQLEQERFDARGPDAGAADASSWQVPWVGRIGDGGSTETERHLLEATRAVVPLSKKPDFVYGNADEGGFFRPLHHPRDLPALVDALPRLAPSERLGFIQHQWALVRAGYAELETFLPLMAALGSERDPDVLRALLGPTDFLVEDLARAAGSGGRGDLQTTIARTFGPALAELGWGPRDGESESNETRLRRAELLTLVGVIAESEEVVSEAEARCADYLRDRRGLDANLIGPVLAVGARHADAERLDRLLDLSESDETPQARRRFRLVIADVRDPVLIENVLLACLTSRIPTQDVAFVLARLIRNPHAGAQAFDFLRANWGALRERVPSMLVSRLIDATPALGNETQRRAVMSFFAANPVPTATRALRQADERFRLDAGFRKRAAPALRRWLAEQVVG
ncbi:MAG TPA: ERAP1-like C-terminal domain-containing protein, partial [Polyangiales bacterium]|nr:ERAP1-like C-terminal domain-containing protein [Polyangiales bacterium]